jgi:phthiodiolone/phenolphthiodiolone dimycocerosates ketoreductase
MSTDVEMGVHLWPSRALPPSAAVAFAQRLEASGVIDWMQTWDQLVSFYPQGLWRQDVTAMAALTPDCDSYYNAAIIAALAAAGTEKLNITTTIDAVRSAPAELLQTMLTIAAAGGGRTSVQIGAGELKQCKPFGHRRSQGLKRMEDIFQIIRKLLDTDGLVSHDGNHWVYRDAWIGTDNRFTKPEFWTVGGGPTLLEIAGKYADGFVTLTPSAFVTHEDWAQQVADLGERIERNGRDPGAFTFGLWPMVLCWDDDEEAEQILENPLVKWMAAVFGRLNHSEWQKEGLDLVFPADFHYAVKLLPHSMSRHEVDDIVSRVSRDMVLKSFFSGTPKQVADQIRPFAEAGATLLVPSDCGLGAVPPERQDRAVHRMVEVAAHVKGVDLGQLPDATTG